MTDTTLFKAVEGFSFVTQGLSGADLARPWDWKGYKEGLRVAFFRTYAQLRELAATLATLRAAQGNPVTTAQRALAQHHGAYRDLQAVLLGVGDDLIDREPAKDEWPLRTIIWHIFQVERVFFAVTQHTLDWANRGEEVPVPSRDELINLIKTLLEVDEAAEETISNGSLVDIMAYYDDLHTRVLQGLADIDEDKLDTPSPWWEETPMPVQFRLHRFDSHLSQHVIQAEETLVALGRGPTEARRLLRIIYNALAEVEGVTIGAWDVGTDQRQALAAEIAARADDVAKVVAG